ncbi:MAG: Transcriptional regulator, AraC family [Candidatus Uhrbacteria bacterium GW2011_GWF2_39_13]|uniref:Transcriptional regulator, AraC family n=1 Tax=Candidatus Uhrbacteria bacterium GW2011_GWF2_39_13 TaxID=1618995 RepID=A0A0G0MNP1_9BACT|nr:MAG: Transcriptional regulator, AraC family [Candidatus Uhrbacteria bacterium GW2011_GWF2_39_13]
MQKTSKITASGFFDPIDLRKNFPVTQPSFKTPPSLAHVHNCFEIGLCRDGAGIFIVEDKVFSCMAGDAIFINNREFHALRNASPLNSDWRFINLDPVALLAGWVPPGEEALDVSNFSGRTFVNVIHEKEHPDIVFMVRKLIDEMETKKTAYRSLVRSIIWSLLIMLQRMIPKEDRMERKEPFEIQRIYPSLHYLSRHYAEVLNIPKLAVLCHCSLSTFRRIFRRSLGCLPLDYVNEFRLKVASTMLLSTRQSIGEIALKSGFSTQSNFNRHFKARFNQSPRDYRIQHSRKKLQSNMNNAMDG